MHLAFCGLNKWHSTHARYEDRPLAQKLPLHTSEIFLFHSTITVCRTLLYHTRCLTAQEQDGKVARDMKRATAYNLPPNFHLAYTLFVIVFKFSFSTPHILHWWLAVSDHRRDQILNEKYVV
jgi:hypothetical protein